MAGNSGSFGVPPVTFVPYDEVITLPKIGIGKIKNVWKGNLREEFKNIRALRGKYNYVAMDTEFPGVVLKPLGVYEHQMEHFYQTVRCNVNVLKLIQLGLSFADGEGNQPEGTSTWQFNFQFDLSKDSCTGTSKELLTKAGLNFEMLRTDGINPNDFAELFISSGYALADDVTWISFHSCYDFAYLIRILTGAPLSASMEDFLVYLALFFPSIYDVKTIMRRVGIFHGGLQQLAIDLDIERIGRQHQAGSDSLTTGMAFFKFTKTYFEGNLEQENLRGVFGFGNGDPVSGSFGAQNSAGAGNGNEPETGFVARRSQTDLRAVARPTNSQGFIQGHPFSTV